MFIKTYLLSALAILASAAPAPVLDASADPSPEAAALAALTRRDTTCTPNGFIIFYPEANFGGTDKALFIFAYQGQKAFCQQFSPVVKGGFSFKSYQSGGLVWVGYKTADCSGDGGIVIAKANGNENSKNVANGSGYLSFQAQYLQ